MIRIWVFEFEEYSLDDISDVRHLHFSLTQRVTMPLRQPPLTLIVKFLGYELDRLPGKLIHQKIMGTYSVILKLGSWARPFTWKTHPIVSLRILGYDTGRIHGKLIQKKAFSRKSYFTDSGAWHRPYYWKTHPDHFSIFKIFRIYLRKQRQKKPLFLEEKL